MLLMRSVPIPATRPKHCTCRAITKPVVLRGAYIVRRAAFDDDPNTVVQTDDAEQPRNRPASTSGREPQAARKTRGLRAKGRGSGKKWNSPTADELKAMGYDDVDDFEDDGSVVYDRMELDENDPLYVPALTDKDLEDDPPGHRSGYVAVIGKPNAGKSSLINALVGQKLSIVSYKPQTTRHRIMGITSDKDYQMILFDTPGIIDRKRTKLEERMMAAVVNSIQNSEAIIAVVDVADRPREALAMFQPGSDWSGPPMAVLLNKTDLVDPAEVAGVADWYKEHCRAEQVFLGSALRGNGVADIKAWAVSKLPEGPTLYEKSTVSEQPERFFVSELIREKIFMLYEQEIPYSVQVNITEFTERRRPAKDFISAQILVEKETQKGVVIGKNGNMLKTLGAEARKDIEEFLGRPVFLEMSVQVAERWRDSKASLEKFGYMDPMLI